MFGVMARDTRLFGGICFLLELREKRGNGYIDTGKAELDGFDDVQL